MSQTLLFCAPAPVIDGGGQLRLDIKFVEGMREHVTGWGGPVHVVLWRDGGEIPFGRDYERAALGFELTVLNPGEAVPESAMRGSTVAMISADMPGFLGLVERARGRVAGGRRAGIHARDTAAHRLAGQGHRPFA